MGRISCDKPASSCAGCFAWGVLPGRCCRACYTFGQNHATASCAACRRLVPVKKGYCRLCWAQASLEAKGQVTVLEHFLRQVRHQQLFLAGLRRPRTVGPLVGKQGRRVLRPRPQPPEPAPVSGWSALHLLDVPRDFSRFDRRRDADLTNPTLTRARHAAHTLGEARGWPKQVAQQVDRALVILLSSHDDGDAVRFSELFPALRRRGLPVGRTAGVLAQIGVLDDDRTPSFEAWLDRKLADIAPGIRRDVEAWVRTLHDGGPRSRPRAERTVWGYLAEVLPPLSDWAHRYGHLREVTRADIVTVRDALQGKKRESTVVALRSLFRHCKQTGAVFRDPTSRVRVGRQPGGLLFPLRLEEIDQAVAAATTPPVRLVLALAAVHAARPRSIRLLRLDDVDLGNRRIVVAGRVRPLDELTHRALLDWLNYRRARWPNTANPHLLLTQHTALDTRPVGRIWLTDAVRGLTATLERLRVDRQLDEALTHGPDPLHLAAVFGLDEKTAIRYATAARQILESSAERYPPASSPRTQGPISPTASH